MHVAFSATPKTQPPYQGRMVHAAEKSWASGVVWQVTQVPWNLSTEVSQGSSALAGAAEIQPLWS